MINLSLVFPEIFLSLSIMFLLILGVFKKNSSRLIQNISLIVLLITAAITFNETFLISHHKDVFGKSFGAYPSLLLIWTRFPGSNWKISSWIERGAEMKLYFIKSENALLLIFFSSLIVSYLK